MLFSKEKLFADFNSMKEINPDAECMFHPNVQNFCTSNRESAQDYIRQYFMKKYIDECDRMMSIDCYKHDHVFHGHIYPDKMVDVTVSENSDIFHITAVFVDISDGIVIHVFTMMWEDPRQPRWEVPINRVDEMIYNGHHITVDEYVDLCNELTKYFPDFGEPLDDSGKEKTHEEKWYN